MEFTTKIISTSEELLDFDSSVTCLGSCFAHKIGHKLSQNKFHTVLNPFGTLFHPYAIFEILKANPTLDEDLYLESSGQSFHYRLPKVFSASNREEFLSKWSHGKGSIHKAMARPKSVLILTLGTSLLYSKDGNWVANCHQQPSALFQKEMSSISAMLDRWKEVLASLPSHLEIIVTVSPVRHLKEGLVESSLSKSQLRVLAEAMLQSDPTRIHYFPAYEIMMDELRDYRFYARDMLHPSEQAIDYIWDRFQEGFFSSSACEAVKAWQKIKSRLDHRPIHPGTEEHRKFLLNLKKDVELFPYFSLENEVQEIQRRLDDFRSV